MIEIKIHGPMYLINNSNATYTAMVSPVTPGIEILWFKNDVQIVQFPGEDQFTLNLFGVEAPAKGVYKAMAKLGSETFTSNELALDIGEVNKQTSVNIFLNGSYPIKKGQLIIIDPEISDVVPANAEVTYRWTYNSELISTDKSISVIPDPNDTFKRYMLEVIIKAPGSFDSSSYIVTTIVREENTPDDFDPRYIHDLRPGRDRGYIWIGWWVHDEIIEAQIDRFDWMADPTNDRFKYKEELETLVYGFSKWPDLEMQESRNGYILRKEDVTVV